MATSESVHQEELGDISVRVFFQYIKRFLFSYLDLPDQLLGVDFKEVWFYSQVGAVKNGWFLCWLQ